MWCCFTQHLRDDVLGPRVRTGRITVSSFVHSADNLHDKFCRRRLTVFAAEQNDIPKSLQTSALRDQRKILKEKIQGWQTVQAVYMPGLLQIQTTLGLSPRGFLWEKQAKPSSLARCTLFKCKVDPVRYQRIGRFVTRCRNFSTVFLLCALEVNTPKSDYQ